MNKLLSAMMAGTAAMVLASTLSIAADPYNKPANETPPRTSENQPGDPSTVKSAPEQARQDQDYVAALKKCDALKGPEKQSCIDSAERKFNRM
jgi:hypothetical protein